MSSQERVESALVKLLERLVPEPRLGEDESASDRRWNEANTLARNALFNHAPSGLHVDVNQAADVIKRRLILDNTGPERATAFGNLYSRLLAQPVLDRKWAILLFLARLGGIEGETNTYADESFARNGLPRYDAEDRDRGPPSMPHSTPKGRPKSESVPEEQPPTNGKGELNPSEASLLRDLPFTLQGLSTTDLPFTEPNCLALPKTLPTPIIALLHTLAEPSLLYRSLSEFVDSSEGGLVGQGLCAAVGVELRSYLGLVATIEGQIRRALIQLDEEGLGKAGVTLKRCVIWTRDATLGLRLIGLIVSSAKGKKGGELISIIHKWATCHGDPFVHSFAERLLSSVTKPFYSMLQRWIYDGELEDPYSEFFVGQNTDYEDSGATSVWESKYLLKEAMIPTIITYDFAQRVFLIGKSLNFIRYGCGDSAWVEQYSKSASRELVYGDTATLGSSIDEAYKTVMAWLISLMETKFSLFAHLSALKNYLLLGQGDFIALLMESLSQNLDRPANSQYRHTLTAQLEHSILHSNAQHDPPEILSRLDARMLELSHGEIGWDVFTLEYRIDSPLDVVITPWASKQYLKVFNFLWRIKRVEFALDSTWRRVQTGSRGVLAAGDKDWKLARGGLAEMIHFIAQLQYYILFEVIEAAWEKLKGSLSRDATLDGIIAAHKDYLSSITRKGLLGGENYATQLHEVLKLMLAYRDAVDALYSYSVAEFTKKQERAARMETKFKAGRWGITEAEEEDETETSTIQTLLPVGKSQDKGTLESIKARLVGLTKDFQLRVSVLLGDLAYEKDLEMRFLGISMNWNEVYPVRRRRGK